MGKLEKFELCLAISLTSFISVVCLVTGKQYGVLSTEMLYILFISFVLLYMSKYLIKFFEWLIDKGET